MRTVWRVVTRLVAVGAILALLLAVVLTSVVAWTVRRSFPQISGSTSLPGLGAQVEVLRDEYGVPQIYADSVDDLMMAQGYVHAQDRFWEMDVRRHITSGRLSEMFGPKQIDTDASLRTLGWHRIAEQEVKLLSDRTRRNLEAYSRGVNAYLAQRTGAELSVEYPILGLQNPSYTVEPWTPADSVAWLKALAWDLRGNVGDEIARTLRAASVGVAQTEKLYPPYPFDRHPAIVRSGEVVDGAFWQDAVPPNASVLPRVSIDRAASPSLRAAARASRLLDDVLGPTTDGIGSNSWVVSGTLTDTGKPLLANDPHLAPAMPSLWYQAGLHCRVVSRQCGYDVAGWTMSGLPGVFIGHNARIAWGFTNLGPDVSDLVLERVDGSTVEYDGARVPLTTRQEVIKVAGQEPVTITVRSTRHGPLISDRGGTFAKVGDRPAPPLTGTYAVALRWTALTPSRVMDAFDVLNTATTWRDFRKAAQLLSVPAQNLIYADVDGNIGYQAPGRIPVRDGYDGRWPVPGWSSKYDWKGYIPFEALPWSLNPRTGFITTANQAVIAPTYPYFLTDDWSYGARSERISQRITEATSDGRRMSLTTMQDIAMDTRNELAAFLAPRLPALATTDASRSATALFQGWDFSSGPDSAPAAYFNAFYRDLVRRMVDSKMGDAAAYADAGDRMWESIRTLWATPTDPWWTDGTDRTHVTRDATVSAALAAAADELSSAQGSAPSRWRWGAMHTLTLTHQTLGTSGIAPIEWLFNRGPYELGGGSSVVNATGWTPSKGYQVDAVPSMRQVVDLTDLDRSTWVNLTGASGHAYNRNYRDQADAWSRGRQLAWPFSRSAVEAATRDRLTLTP